MHHIQNEGNDEYGVKPWVANVTKNGSYTIQDNFDEIVDALTTPAPSQEVEVAPKKKLSFWEIDGDEERIVSLPEELIRDVKQDWAKSYTKKKFDEDEDGGNDGGKRHGKRKEKESEEGSKEPERDFPVQFDDGW